MPSRAVVHPPKNRNSNGLDSTSRSPRHHPFHGRKTVVDPLPGLDSLSECHQYVTTKQTVIPESIALLRPYRGFFPFSVFQSKGATYPRRVPIRRLRCALRFSHPLGAFLPFRPSGLISSRCHSWGSALRGFSSSPGAVRPLERRAPQGFSLDQKRRGHPSRDSHTKRSPPPGLVFTQVPERCLPPWAFVFRGFLPSTVERCRRTFSSPLALLRFGRIADLTAGTPGFSLPRTQPLSLEIG